jgi:hypothetical protein
VAYADTMRRIPPREQMVHSLLEMLPVAALLLLIVAYPAPSLALVGATGTPADFGLRPGDLPVSYIAAMMTAALLLNALPYGEELIRCLREPPGPEALKDS